MSAAVAPIGWFEIAGSDPARTEAFYASLFNWTFTDGPGGPDYRMADTGSLARSARPRCSGFATPITKRTIARRARRAGSCWRIGRFRG